MSENQPTPPAVPEPTSADLKRDAVQDYQRLPAPLTTNEAIAVAYVRLAVHYKAALAAERERAEKAEARCNYHLRERVNVAKENEALRAEVEGLRRGLEPFARFVDNTEDKWDGDFALVLEPRIKGHSGYPSLADCRHARQLLERPRPT